MSDTAEFVREAMHPGETPSPEDMLANTDDATRWYNEAVWYAARCFYEAAVDHEPVADAFEAFLNQPANEGGTSDERRAIRPAMREHAPEKWAEINEMGLSAFQGGSAENAAARALADDGYIEEADDE